MRTVAENGNSIIEDTFKKPSKKTEKRDNGMKMMKEKGS